MKEIASCTVLYTYSMGHYLHLAVLVLFMEDGAPFTVIYLLRNS